MDKKVLFEALNTELAKENIDLEIICKCFNIGVAPFNGAIGYQS